MLFRITAAFERVTDITTQFLAENGIKGLILDLDNTLTTHDNPVPAEGVLDWLDRMKKSGIRLMIVSNNHAPRVTPFAEMLGLPFVSEGAKPLADVRKAMKIDYFDDAELIAEHTKKYQK